MDTDETNSADVLLAIPAAIFLFLARKISEFTLIEPLCRRLKIDDCRNVKKNPTRFEMFCEHTWEFLFYAVNFLWALTSLWNCSYFWNYDELFLNYPNQVK